METFRFVKDFVQWAPTELLETKVKFSYMDSGLAFFSGDYGGSEMWCNIGEEYAGDLCFDVEETTGTLLDCSYITLHLNGKCVLNV